MPTNWNCRLRRILSYTKSKFNVEIRRAIHADDMPQLMILAAMQGNVPLVIYAKQHGGQVLNADQLLTWTAKTGHLDMVQYFSAEASDMAKRGAYVWAARYGHVNVMKYLHGPGVNQGLALKWAAKNGHLEVVRNSNVCGVDADYALNWAAENGQLEVVHYLLSKRRAPYFCENYAIRWAARNGHLDIVRCLAAQDEVDITAKHNYAIRWAARNGHLDIVCFLLKQGADATSQHAAALRWAARQGHLAVVQYLHGQGLDIHSLNNYAVIGAAINGHLDVVRYLLTQGVGIGIHNHDIMDRAVRGGHLALVQYLHSQGVDVTMAENYFLRAAVCNNKPDVASYLVQHGCDIRAVCVSGKRFSHLGNGHVLNRAALETAARAGYLGILKWAHLRGVAVVETETRHPAVKSYFKAKLWLQTQASCLVRLAAEIYVSHYHIMPEPESVPENVTQALSAARICQP